MHHNNLYNFSFARPEKSHLAALISFALIASFTALFVLLCAPSAAHAEPRVVPGETVHTGSDSTAVFLEADDSMLAVSVPTEIHVMVKPDGSFITPSAESAQIKNGSVFGVHVETIHTLAQNNFALVPDASKATQNDAIQYAFKPLAASELTAPERSQAPDFQIGNFTGGKAVDGPHFNLTKAGSSGAVLNLATSGKIANVTKDLHTDQQFATINWTFQAGANN